MLDLFSLNGNYKDLPARNFIFSVEFDKFREEQIIMLRSNGRVSFLNAPFFEMESCIEKFHLHLHARAKLCGR